jgi:hypothetical protein
MKENKTNPTELPYNIVVFSLIGLFSHHLPLNCIIDPLLDFRPTARVEQRSVNQLLHDVVH